MRFRTETIGDATLIMGDCREVLPTLEPVDAVLTDPPYGMPDAAWRGPKTMRKGQGRGAARLMTARPEWDVTPSAELLQKLICDRPAIIWGGNYMPGLPPQRGWLVWDKLAASDQAQAELAWTNAAPNVRVFGKSTLGVFGNGGRNRELKVHPTQKPIELMVWCLDFLPESLSILDPFMGSGSTGVACVATGRRFVGIEREPTYFDIACRRIEEAHKQPRLFSEPPPKPVQEALF